tara:strand:+ start:313 stop:696 length:384 start_codon:yes stop_codon:yes gene_type:complete
MPLSKIAMRELSRERRRLARGEAKPDDKPEEKHFAGQKRILSKKDRLERLSELALGNAKLANPVEALKEMSKLLGEYPALKHQVAGKVIFEVVHINRKELSNEDAEAIETTGETLLEEDTEKDVAEG